MNQTIEPRGHEYGDPDYAVFEHGVYESSSVLAGHPKRVFVDCGSLEELKEKYPRAEVLDHSTRVEVQLPETPPDWFDPTYAGEEW